MKDLSIGVLMAWQIAAVETAEAKHQFIEKEQILIGISSLEKSLISPEIYINIVPSDVNKLKNEHNTIEEILQHFKINSTNLRRKVRKKCGQGNYQHTEKIIHRSEECKKFFSRADELTEDSSNIECTHLFTAILEHCNGKIYETLKELNIEPLKILERAKLYLKKKKIPEKKENSYFI